MVEPSPENMTLREVFVHADRFTRELVEHLEQGFMPKAESLVNLVRPTPDGSPAKNVKDITIRNQVSSLLESENFTEQLSLKLKNFCDVIEKNTSDIIDGKS